MCHECKPPTCRQLNETNRLAGVLYMTCSAFKSTVYPTHDLAIWGWKLGLSRRWYPVAIIPATPGTNQAGTMQFAKDGTIYVAIGNQVVKEVNGVYRVTNPWDMFGTSEVKQVFALPRKDTTMYAFFIDWAKDASTPAALWTTTHNETISYTKNEEIGGDNHQIVSYNWKADADEFDTSEVQVVDDIYHRGMCVFGCAIWDILMLRHDTATNNVHIMYKNGDGNQFYTTYSRDRKQIDSSCYFYWVDGSQTYPKFSTPLHTGVVSDRDVDNGCPCSESNGKKGECCLGAMFALPS